MMAPTTTKDEKRDMTAVRALWYEARDTYFGINERKENKAVGAFLIRKCRDQIPDAAWFCDNVLENGGQISNVLVNLGILASTGDARALYFLGMFQFGERRFGNDLITQAAKAGYGPAQGWLSHRQPAHKGAEGLMWAGLAAAQDEPEGHFALYVHNEIIPDEDSRDWHARRAAELGFVDAMLEYGGNIREICPEKMYWMCMAARAGTWSRGLCDLIRMCVTCSVPGEYFETCVNLRCARKSTYQIGEVFCHCVYGNNGLFCGKEIGIESGQYIRESVILFCKWNNAARDAVIAWILVARRIGIRLVAPDVRKIISRLVWESRSDALHHMSLRNSK